MSSESDGSRSRDVVLEILKKCGVVVSELRLPGGVLRVILEKGTTLEAYDLEETVRARMLHRLAWKYEVEVHHFWRPKLIQ